MGIFVGGDLCVNPWVPHYACVSTSACVFVALFVRVTLNGVCLPDGCCNSGIGAKPEYQVV